MRRNISTKAHILVDANVPLDVLAKREPHYATSAAVWALVEQGEIEGLLAAHTVTTLHYLVIEHLNRWVVFDNRGLRPHQGDKK